MNQPDLLRRTVELLEDIGSPYMVVGSYASSVYGEPRLTRDIDIVVDLRNGGVNRLCDFFTAPDYSINRNSIIAAMRRMGHFNVIHLPTGNKIDFMMARDDAWGRTQLGRPQKVRLLEDREGFAARPEEIILSKLQFFQMGESDKHLADICAMLRVSGDGIDRDYIESWTPRFKVSDEWRVVLKRYEDEVAGGARG